MNPDVTFQIDVSRQFKNKTGYDHGYKLNTSFQTETHTPQSLVDNVIKPGWPYTMAHQKRSPQETGADKRGVKTPKHTENFLNMQVLTGDDDSATPDVVDFWLNDPFFSRHGWLFVESVNSKPGAQKGHPTLLFDVPITDGALYKECLQAFCSAYPRLDWLVNVDRTVYNGQGATVHELGNVCPFVVFEREILTPWRETETAKQTAVEAEHKRRRAEYEKHKADGGIVSSNVTEAYLAGYLNWLFDHVAATHKGDNPPRNSIIYWAGRCVSGVESTPWAQPHLGLLNDVDRRIVNAADANGYLTDYAHGDEREVLRVFNRGRAAGGEPLDEPLPRSRPNEQGSTPPPKHTFSNDLVKVPAPHVAVVKHSTVAQVRAALMPGILEYLSMRDPGYMVVYRVTPGVGKTTAAVGAALVKAEMGARVGYAGPRHAFFGDVMQAIEVHGGQYEKVYEWLPRQDGNDSELHPDRQTCLHSIAINAWMRKGHNAMDFCSGICGWNYVNDACVYHAQRRRTEPIIFIQHQHVTLGHALTFDVLIGDENPLSAFVNTREICTDDLIGDCPTGDFRRVLEALTVLSARDRIEGVELIEAILRQTGFVLSKLIDVCASATMPLDATPAGGEKPRSLEEAANAKVWYTPALVSLLLRETRAYQEERPQITRLEVGAGALRMFQRRSPSERLPRHVVWLDATADERIYETLFQRPVKMVRAEPSLKGRIFQVWNRANGKTSLLKPETAVDDDGNVTKTVTATTKVKQLTHLVDCISEQRGYENIAVISFKGLRERWEFSETAEQGHFYAARGSNVFENCDAGFVVGSPMPSLDALKRLTAQIFFERDAAFNVAWSRRNVTYNYTDENGDGWAYPIGNFWGDPDLEAVVTTHREEEIIHAAHRVRPVFRDVDVWLLTNISIDALPPTNLVSMGELLSTPAGTNNWKWRDFVTAVKGWNVAVVTGKMIMARLGLSNGTAYKYLRLLAETEGWELAVVKTDKRGPKTQGVRKAI